MVEDKRKKRWILGCLTCDEKIYSFWRMLRAMELAGLVKRVKADKKVTHVGLDGFGEVRTIGRTVTEVYDVGGEIFVFRDTPRSEPSMEYSFEGIYRLVELLLNHRRKIYNAYVKMKRKPDYKEDVERVIDFIEKEAKRLGIPLKLPKRRTKK